MSRRRGRSWDRSLAVARALAVLYLLFLATGPLHHHDVACHLKSWTHCPTCVYASVPGTEAHAGLDAFVPQVADQLSVARADRPVVIFASDPGGRSPPSL